MGLPIWSTWGISELRLPDAGNACGDIIACKEHPDVKAASPIAPQTRRMARKRNLANFM
jgi:hypothetical protein